MIKLRAIELLQEKGKTKYWLYKQLGMSYQNFTKMINNQTKSIQYANIEALCHIFECDTNTLFEFVDESDFEQLNGQQINKYIANRIY